MKVFCAIFFYFFLAQLFTSSAQISTLDLTQNVKSLAKKGERYVNSDADSSIFYGKALYDYLEINKSLISDTTLVQQNLIRAHYFLACGYGVKRVKEEMFSHYQQALTLAKKTNHLEYIAKAGANLGIELLIEGRQEGHQYILTAHNAAVQLNSKEALVKTQGALAYFYQFIKEYEKALEYLRDNQKMMEAGEVDYSVLTAISIGESYIHLEKPDSAVYFLEQSLKNYDKLKLEIPTAPIRTYLGIAYLGMGQNVEAWGHLRIALSIFKKHNQLVWPEAYLFLGEVFENLGAADSAKFYYQKSIDQSTAVKSETTNVQSYRNLARINASINLYPEAVAAKKMQIQKFKTGSINQKKIEIIKNTLAFEQIHKQHEINLLRDREKLIAAHKIDAEEHVTKKAEERYGSSKTIFIILSLVLVLSLLLFAFIFNKRKRVVFIFFTILSFGSTAQINLTDTLIVDQNIESIANLIEMGQHEKATQLTDTIKHKYLSILDLHREIKFMELQAQLALQKKDFKSGYDYLDQLSILYEIALNEEIKQDKERMQILADIKKENMKDSLFQEARNTYKELLLEHFQSSYEDMEIKAQRYKIGSYLIGLAILLTWGIGIKKQIQKRKEQQKSING